MSSSHSRHRRIRFFNNNLPHYNDSDDDFSNVVGTTDKSNLASSVSGSAGAASELVQSQGLESSTLLKPQTPSSVDKETGTIKTGCVGKSNPATFNEIVDCGLIKKRIDHLVSLIVEKQKCNSDENCCDGGLYVGISGISYMFYYLASSTGDNLFNPTEKDFFTKQALRYLLPTIDYANSPDKSDRLSSVAYLLGFAGVYVVAALIYDQVGDAVNRDFYVKKYGQIASKCLPKQYLTKGSDELLVGRAGYICGAYILNKRFGQTAKVIPEGVLLALALSSIRTGREYSARRGLQNICPLMYSYHGTEYLGAAHGLSGILQALLTVPGILNPQLNLEKDIKRSVDYLLSLQTESGNFPCALDELVEPTKGKSIRREEDELIHWCHGAPGVIWLMARAYLIWKEDKYLDSCIKSGELVWSKGLLRKGPGICHGIAGNALVFLLLYRLTGKVTYLHQANQFQEFLFTEEFRLGSRTPDSPYSMFEGWAGTICFLVDLLQPEKSHFPLYFDPFDDTAQLYLNVEPKI